MGCYYVIGLRVDHRRANAAGLQETLTRHGCNIRLRVGLHEAGEGRCADDGVILLQVCGEQGEVDRLMAALELRNLFFYDPLEKQVAQQFSDYIREQQKQLHSNRDIKAIRFFD